MKINDTEEKKRAAIIANIDKNVFVEAGAGAGKTTLIISRVESLLKSGVQPENIVVITFTNKATEVLISRLNDKIMMLAGDDSLNTEERANLENASRHISRMQVSTIHGFCSRLLSENALSVGLSVSQTIIDESQSLAEQKVLFEAFFKENYDQGNFEALMTIYDSLYEMKKELFELYSQFLKVCNKDVVLPNENDAVPQLMNYKKRAAELFKELKAAINTEVKQNFDCKDVCVDEHLNSFLTDFRNAFIPATNGIDMIKNIKVLDGYIDKSKILTRNKLTIKPQKIKDENGKNYTQTQLVEKTNAAIKNTEAAKNIRTFLSGLSKAKNILLQKSLRESLNYYYAERDNSLLTNDMLLEKTRDLLLDNPDLVKDLSCKFKHIFIDEFQDVDHFQAQMALCFYRAGSKLFVVGDPKQSIYRFRGAEPKIFDAVKQMYVNSSEDQVFELDNNYRSAQPVLKWINDSYRNSFDNYNDMMVSKKAYGQPLKSTTLQGVYAGPDYSGEMSDAERVSRIVKGLIDNKNTILDTKLVDGKEVYEERVITPKDFLVLAWDTRNFPELVKSFRAAEVPCIVSGNLQLGVYCVLERYMLIYRHLAGAGDYKLTLEGAIEAVLHIACEKTVSREKAKCILEKWGKETYRMNGMQLAGYLLGKLQYMFPRDEVISNSEMVSTLGKIHQMIETITVSEGAVDPKKFYDSIRNYFSGKLSYEIEFGDGSDDAVRVMNMDKAKGLEGKIVILMYRDAMNGKTNDYYIETITEDSKGKQLDILNWEYKFYYKDILSAKESGAEESDSKAEFKRKQYVIVTRAEEALIVLDCKDKASRDYLEGLSFSGEGISDSTIIKNFFADEEPEKAESLESASEDILKSAPEPSGEGVTEAVSEESTDTEIVFEEKMVLSSVPEKQKKSILVSITPSGLEHEEKKNKSEPESDENTVQEAEEGIINDTETDEEGEDTKAAEKRPCGNVFGSVMHRAFELLMNYIRGKSGITEDDISECIMIAVSENLNDIRNRYAESYKEKCVEYTEYLKNVLGKFIQDEGIKSLLDRTVQFYTEYDFSFWTSIVELGSDYEVLKPYLEQKGIQIDDDQKIYVNGIVDMMLLTDDGNLHIIDYKSDTKVRKVDGEYSTYTDGEFRDHLKKYDGQLALYRIAMSKVFGIPQDKISTALYDLYDGIAGK